LASNSFSPFYAQVHHERRFAGIEVSGRGGKDRPCGEALGCRWILRPLERNAILVPLNAEMLLVPLVQALWIRRFEKQAAKAGHAHGW
jgi:hypothetical protein